MSHNEHPADEHAHEHAHDGHAEAGATEPAPDDDPLVEAPGFGVTNREYWPRSWVKAAEQEEAEAGTPAAEPAPDREEPTDA